MKFEGFQYVIYCDDEYDENYENTSYWSGKRYYRGHLIHREDGPAEEWHNGNKYWYLNGIQYTEEEYNKIMNLKKNREILNEI